MKNEQALLSEVEQLVRQLKTIDCPTEGARYAALMGEFSALAQRSGHLFPDPARQPFTGGAMLGREWREGVGD